MSSTIKTVAHAGAAGSLGIEVLKGLVQAGFDVRVLSRKAGKVPAAYANQVKEVVVNYDDPASLKSALDGVDAVVSTLGAPAVGGPQRALVDAAVSAGVQRFIPSNFGCDQQNPLTRQLPVFAEKVKTEDYLTEKAKSSSLSYTFVYNNLFLDWGFSHGSLANIKDRRVVLYNGGDLAISVTRLATVAKGVVGVLKNLDATRNHSVRIEDGKISFKQIAAIAKDALPGQWTITEADTDALKESSDQALKAGTVEGWVWFNYILQGGTNAKYGPAFENIDNNQLGLARLSDGELQALVKDIITQTARDYQLQKQNEGTRECALRLAAQLQEQIPRLGLENVSAFIAETVTGTTLGYVSAVPGYFKDVRALCNKYKILLILDELWEVASCRFRAFFYGGIFSRLWSVDYSMGTHFRPIQLLVLPKLRYQEIIKNECLLDNVTAMGQKLGSILEQELGSLELVGNIRGRSLTWAVEFVRDTRSKILFEPGTGFCDKVVVRARELGLNMLCGKASQPAPVPAQSIAGESDGPTADRRSLNEGDGQYSLPRNDAIFTSPTPDLLQSDQTKDGEPRPVIDDLLAR